MKKMLFSMVFMIFSCLIFLSKVTIAEGNYKYTIDIEWGSLSFVYDKGCWDTSKLEYCSDDSSLFPAKGTIAGAPGWYGFNGEANKITIYNSSTNDSVTANVSVSTQIKDTEGIDIESQPDYNASLQYSIYKDNNWNCFEGYENGNNSDVTNIISANDSVSYYISIEGELDVESENFNIPQNIGSVTIQIAK